MSTLFNFFYFFLKTVNHVFIFFLVFFNSFFQKRLFKDQGSIWTFFHSPATHNGFGAPAVQQPYHAQISKTDHLENIAIQVFDDTLCTEALMRWHQECLPLLVDNLGSSWFTFIHHDLANWGGMSRTGLSLRWGSISIFGMDPKSIAVLLK